jgi:hypothetical protein
MKAHGVPTNDLPIFTPDTILILTPYFDFALEASTCSPSCFVFSCSDQVVDTERMRLV